MDGRDVHDEATAIAWALALSDPAVGNGDDAAIFRVGGGSACVSTDSTIAGVHAPAATPPYDLGRRAAARALSDLAAMGAAPIGLTCAMHVPAAGWADAATALQGVADRGGEQHAPLLGGDFTRTPSDALALIVTVLGRRAGARGPGSATGGGGFVQRHRARRGDELFVTGTLGAAAQALADGELLPEPPDRIAAGCALARHASAMVDLSDGIARDASLLDRAPNLVAHVELGLLPCAEGVSRERAAGGGDDYELLVAIAPERVSRARADLARACPELALTLVGRIADAGEADGLPRGGFLHQ